MRFLNNQKNITMQVYYRSWEEFFQLRENSSLVWYNVLKSIRNFEIYNVCERIRDQVNDSFK